MNNSILNRIYEFSYDCKMSYSNEIKYFKKIRNDLGLDCFIKNDDETKVLKIIFVGTNEKKDWLCNLNFKRYYFNKKEFIHNGVYKMYKKSSSEIISEILKLKFNKIVIIGHSLGGYLCQAMAYDLLINYNIKSNIFIYGSGLIISKEIQKLFWKNNIILFEIILKEDIVPKLLKLIYPSYYSIKIKINSKNKFSLNIIKNHLMITYLNSFENILHNK